MSGSRVHMLRTCSETDDGNGGILLGNSRALGRVHRRVVALTKLVLLPHYMKVL